MFELDDVGMEVHARVTRLYTDCDVDVKIQMVIKAPRGAMVLFVDEPRLPKHPSRYSTLKDKFLFPRQTRQCQAIKAFMKQHSVVGDPLLHLMEEHKND